MKTPPYIIGIDDSIEEVKPNNKMCFTSKEIKEIVGEEYIILHVKDDLFIIYNEEGKKEKFKLLNAVATNFSTNVLKPTDYITGNVLVTPGKYLEQES